MQGRRLPKLQLCKREGQGRVYNGRSCQNQRRRLGSCGGGEEAIAMRVRLMIKRTAVAEELRFIGADGS